MCARHCFLPSIMSWIPTSASQPGQFPCDVPVQLLAPPVAIGPGPLATGQRRAEALDVVAQHLVNALPIRRCFFEQPEDAVEDRHQVATRETRIGEDVNLDLFPRRPVVGGQCLVSAFECFPFPGEVAAGHGLPEVLFPPSLSLSMRDERYS